MLHRVLERELTGLKYAQLQKHAYLGVDMHGDQRLKVDFLYKYNLTKRFDSNIAVFWEGLENGLQFKICGKSTEF